MLQRKFERPRGWIFSIELAFRLNGIHEGSAQVDFATSFLQRNALLWFLACLDLGRSFSDWESLKVALRETYGPLDAEEINRLALLSIYQNGSLDGYIRDFTQLSLHVSDLDDHSIPTRGGGAHCAPPPPPGTLPQISQERLELRT